MNTFLRVGAAALMAGLAVMAHAGPLVLNNVPVARAASQLSAQYGVTVSLQKYSGRRVRFTIEDPDAPGVRLQAVNALANAAGLEFTKVYVIGKAVNGHAVPPQVDTEGVMPQGPKTLSARDAIAMVAGVDDATTQIAGDVGGAVTLSGAPLSVRRAAEEIAQQTGTAWQTRYVLTPRAQASTWGGTVVGHADGGAPIIQLAYVYYVDPQKEAERQRAADAAQRQADQELAAAQKTLAQQTVAQQTAVQQAAALRMAQGGLAMFANGYGSGYYPSPANPNSGVPQNGAYSGYGGYGGYASPYSYGGGYGGGTTRGYSINGGVTVLNGGGYGVGTPYGY